MKLRIFMVFTLALMGLLFLLPLLGNRLYRPEYRGLPHDWNENDFELYADDATLLRGTETEPEGTFTGTVVLLADSNLDRDWTAGGRGLPVGKILARRLAGMGQHVLRYDQRGTGVTIQSGRNYPSPANLARDLRRLLERKRIADASAPGGLTLLAHGDACAVALNALNRYAVEARRVMFVGCSLQGTLLEQWLGRILANMRKSGVAPENLEKARARLEEWRRARSYADSEATASGRNTEGLHPDLQALERALEEMGSERLVDFTREAEAFDFLRERDRLLARGSTHVVHLIGQRDLVLLPEERSAARADAQKLTARYADHYRFEILADTDHFLAERGADPGGSLPLLIANLNPLRRISPAFLNALDQIFAVPPATAESTP